MKRTSAVTIFVVAVMLAASITAIALHEEKDENIYRIHLSEESKKIIDQMEPIETLSEKEWPTTNDYLLNRPDTPSNIPVGYEPKSNMEMFKVNGCYVYTLTDSTSYDNIILYLHGGAYVFDMYPQHVTFCDDLAQNTSSKVYLPCYPLAPKHTFEETFALLDAVYKTIQSEHKKVIIMGDSAGGGMTLAYTMYLKERHLVLPDKLVMLSPFLDVTMSNPDIPKYEEKDIKLKSYGLVHCGKYWAGDTPVTDYRISPINGNMYVFPPHSFSWATPK